MEERDENKENGVRQSTRSLCWGGPRNFEPRSDDEDDARAGTSLSKLPLHARGRAFGPLRMIWRATGPIHEGPSMESGFEPGALRPQSRDLTTRPPCPH
ncbi:hypothetical protein AVEN_93884-1 [Araneus ventricosus]|uniref:Uncharacterized protein n=1 Tax=Araneus ventricosus TaxID=182803 RepID=A0A4Y2AXS0_ARAVE|nr:hypothetical protein AVEN_93884-1 [Araneus ventricosus]